MLFTDDPCRRFRARSRSVHDDSFARLTKISNRDIPEESSVLPPSFAPRYSSGLPSLYAKYALHVSFFHSAGPAHRRRYRYFPSVIASRSTARLFEQRHVSVWRERPPLTPRPVSASSLHLSFCGNVRNSKLTVDSSSRYNITCTI